MNVLEARRRMLGAGVYKKTVTGNPAIAQGSLARMYPGIEMQGWSKQDGTPTPENPVPIVSAGNWNEETQKWEYGVKLTGANLFDPANLTGGEIVEYNGVQCYKYTDNAINFTYVDDFAENTQYCFSAMILSSDGNEEKNTNIIIWYTDGTATIRVAYYNQLVNIVSSANKTVDKITGSDNWSTIRYIDLSITTLRIGTEPLIYQPYKEQTVLLQSDRPLTKWDRLEKRNGQWGWVYKSKNIEITESFGDWNMSAEGEAFNVFYRTCLTGRDYTKIDNAYCKQLSRINALWVESNRKPYSFSIQSGNELIYVCVPASIAKTPTEYAQWLSENPLTVLYQTTEETFVPLSTSEQEQMNALHTNRPTTVLSNNQNCDMSLTYKTRKSMEVTT